MLPAHHGCNPNCPECLHKLKIQTIFSKNRKMNFRLEIKLTVNSSWFQLCEPKINNLKSKSPRKLALLWASSHNCLYCWGEKFAPWNKILPVHHGCNPSDPENLHKLKIGTAFSKKRKMNFGLEIKLRVNSFWFQLCEPKISNLKSKWFQKLAQEQIPTTNCLHWWERALLP